MLLYGIYTKRLRTEFHELDKVVALNLSCHGINRSANTERLLPTLLVFSNIHKISIENVEYLCPNRREWFEALESAWKEMEVIVASQRLETTTESRYKSVEIFSTPSGYQVFVYREKSKNGKYSTNCTKIATAEQYK